MFAGMPLLKDLLKKKDVYDGEFKVGSVLHTH